MSQALKMMWIMLYFRTTNDWHPLPFMNRLRSMIDLLFFFVKEDENQKKLRECRELIKMEIAEYDRRVSDGNPNFQSKYNDLMNLCLDIRSDLLDIVADEKIIVESDMRYIQWVGTPPEIVEEEYSDYVE